MSSSKEEIMEALWSSFDSMRGIIDIRDSRNYILGILLLKKASEDFQDKIINWAKIKTLARDIGKELNEAFYRYEQNYTYTERWFKELDFDSNQIGSLDIRDNLWKEIIFNLSKIDLSLFEENNPGALCDLILEINERFSISEGIKGSFETPLCIIRLLSELLFTKEGSTIYDPFCSSGTTLMGPACYIKKINQNIALDLFGQTPNPKNLLTSYLNLTLIGNTEAKVVYGDVIRNPFLYDGQRIKTFQKVLSTIPMGVKNWGEEIAQYDPYLRFRYGVPPRTQGEYGYLQHCIASLSDDGILAVVVPPSMLFRERSEGEIRKRIINDDIIEAVIGLPPKIYPQTPIQFAVFVINRKKAKDRKEKILFINTMNDYLPGRSQNILRDSDVSKVLTAFKDFRDIEGYSRVCSLDEIAKNNYQLEVSQYIKQKIEIVAPFDLDVTITELDVVHSEKNAAYKEMQVSLRKLRELQKNLEVLQNY